MVLELEAKMQKKIDDAAIMYNKTKDPYYKDLWYKLIRELAHGIGYYNSKRRIVPFNPNDENNVRRDSSDTKSRLF